MTRPEPFTYVIRNFLGEDGGYVRFDLRDVGKKVFLQCYTSTSDNTLECIWILECIPNACITVLINDQKCSDKLNLLSELEITHSLHLAYIGSFYKEWRAWLIEVGK